MWKKLALRTRMLCAVVAWSGIAAFAVTRYIDWPSGSVSTWLLYGALWLMCSAIMYTVCVIVLGPVTRWLSPEFVAQSELAKDHLQRISALTLQEAEQQAQQVLKRAGIPKEPQAGQELASVNAKLPSTVRRLFGSYSRVLIDEGDFVIDEREVGPAKVLAGQLRIGYGSDGEELSVDPVSEALYVAASTRYRSRSDAGKYPSVFHWIVYQETLPALSPQT